MEIIECIKTRRSIRKFKPEPVPKKVLMEIFDIARWSPSYKNSQPWECIILSGSKKEALSKMLIGLLEKNADLSPDIPEPKSWPSAVEARIERTFKRTAEAMGNMEFDLNALKEAKKANFNFYGAPHAIYLFQDSTLTPWSMFDLGLFAQNIMLIATSKGLGTVPQAFVTDYAKDVKKFLSIPEKKRLVIGISIGYADLDAPGLAFRSDRADKDELVRWIE